MIGGTRDDMAKHCFAYCGDGICDCGLGPYGEDGAMYDADDEETENSGTKLRGYLSSIQPPQDVDENALSEILYTASERNFIDNLDPHVAILVWQMVELSRRQFHNFEKMVADIKM